MKPTIDFHGITSLQLTEVKTLINSHSGRPFSTRTLVLTDAEGNTFRVGLFAETAEALCMKDAGGWWAEPRLDSTPPPALDPKTGKLVPW